MDSNVKLSNVIGAPFSDYVLQQLYTRAVRNSTVNRTNEEVLFLANKTSWTRLVSSVNLDFATPKDQVDFYSSVGSGVSYSTPDGLAKDWILEAGTSKQNGNGVTLREGIGIDGAYGLGGIEELGYRPMPGLTSVQIETTGRLGSLRQATINFKVWNMNQLNAVEALYFRLGYSMLLEWGHTQYFANDNTFQRGGVGGIDDPFSDGVRKEEIQQKITQKTRSSSGNYGGMLGIVSNFTWSFNQDGGYDCVVRLIGQGAIIDSMRTNQIYTLPKVLGEQFQKNQSAIEGAIEREAQANARKLQEQENRVNNEEPTTLLLRPTTVEGLDLVAQTYDGVAKNYASVKYAFTKASAAGFDITQAARLSSDYYYLPTGKSGDTTAFKDKLIQQYAGLYRSLSTSIFNFYTFIPAGSSVSINTEALDNWTQNWLINRTPDYRVPSGYSYSTNIEKVFDAGTKVRVYTVNATDITQADRLENGTSTTIYYYDGSSNLNSPSILTSDGSKTFYFTITYNLVSENQTQYYPTKDQVVKALGEWFQGLPSNTYQAPNSRTITNVSFNVKGSGKNKSLVVKGTSDVIIKDVPNRANRNTNEGSSFQDVVITFTFETNDTGLLLQPTAAPQIPIITPQLAQQANTGDSNGAANQPGVSTVEAATKFESALRAMLVVVQTKGQAEALNAVDVKVVDIRPDTELFYQDGSLKGVLGYRDTEPTKDTSFDLIKYGAKGYNSSLMADSTLYPYIKSVDFDAFCKAYAVKYPQGGLEGTQDSVHVPVYITLGYLLAFLNNMCLIYDSTTPTSPAAPASGGQKRPYVYIDFNPETNFCLTTPQQLSVDPFTCLIPLDATLEDYKSIFPPNTVGSIKDPPLFNPELNNPITQALEQGGLKFKVNAYQGKLMNILLNTDYLLGITQQFTGSDPEHAVNLQPFLERILTDVNKCLGNINLFRVAYRDESNTIQITDDQWVPYYQASSGDETSIMTTTGYSQRLSNQPITSGLLPIFSNDAPAQVPVVGTQSLVRQFQFKTVMSTKLASMIAISAQSNTGSVNAKDHSSLSWLNRNYQDRYKPYVQDQSNSDTGANENAKSKINEASNDQKVADLFNVHIESIYSNRMLSADKIETAKNYYIERMSKVKSENELTTSAPFIPADLEITMDGVSGIIMGNAFTIPEDRLPISLRGENGLTKIAFIVTGLTHILSNNEWLTRIKGQMIKLRQQIKIPTAFVITGPQSVIAPPVAKFQGLTGNVIDDAINFIKSLERLYSARAGRYEAINNPLPSTIVYAYKVGNDKATIGWGTTYYNTGIKKGIEVNIKDTITVAEAESEIRAEVAKDAAFIEKNLKTPNPLTSGQKIALISFGYNLGLGGLQQSSIWKLIEQGADIQVIAQEFLSYGNAAGQSVAGLVKRRQLESQLYLS